MAANGLFYTASFSAQSLTNAAQNIWEIIPSASVSILIHWWRLEFSPTIVSGVAQDVRPQLAVQTITTTGTGGSSVTPEPTNQRNTVAATCTFNRMVTTPGSAGVVMSAHFPSIIVPWELVYTPDMRMPVDAGKRLALNLAAGIGAFTVSGTIGYEEL